MGINGKNNCFIALKDHKANSTNSPTNNPYKSWEKELLRIRKVILDKTNKRIQKQLS